MVCDRAGGGWQTMGPAGNSSNGCSEMCWSIEHWIRTQTKEKPIAEIRFQSISRYFVFLLPSTTPHAGELRACSCMQKCNNELSILPQKANPQPIVNIVFSIPNPSPIVNGDESPQRPPGHLIFNGIIFQSIYYCGMDDRMFCQANFRLHIAVLHIWLRASC